MVVPSGMVRLPAVVLSGIVAVWAADRIMPGKAGYRRSTSMRKARRYFIELIASRVGGSEPGFVLEPSVVWISSRRWAWMRGSCASL